MRGLMKKIIYKITINNWDKYNGSLKAGHKKIMVSTGFLADAKIRSLTPVTKLLYLSCLLVAGELTQSQIEVSHDSLVYQSGVKSGSIQSQLDLLESLQLLSYEKSLPNRREENRREEKIREVPARSRPDPKAKQLNQKIWDSYRDSYASRYKTEPVRNAAVNAKISQIGKRLGEDAVEVVKFFLTHQDSFYLKSLHAIGLCLRDAEALHTQFVRGKAITGNDVRQFEKQSHYADQAARIKSGEL